MHGIGGGTAGCGCNYHVYALRACRGAILFYVNGAGLGETSDAAADGSGDGDGLYARIGVATLCRLRVQRGVTTSAGRTNAASDGDVAARDLERASCRAEVAMG